MSALSNPLWQALRPFQQRLLLEKWWNVNVDVDDWYEYEYERLKEELDEIGVTVGSIYFSGFSCQGDGACFEFSISNWTKFLTKLERLDLVQLLDDGQELSWAGKHRGNYYHANSIEFDGMLALYNPYDDPDGGEDDNPRWFERDAWDVIASGGDAVQNFESDMIEWMRDRMNELYRDLEKEYDYQTSNERVVETLLDMDVFDEFLQQRLEKRKGRRS